MRGALWIILCCLMAASTEAATASLRWQNPPGPLTGITLYQGETSGVYTQQIPLGVVTQATVGGLSPGRTYVFAVSASNTAGESGLSNEVTYVVADLGVSGDQDPPTVAITKPPAGTVTRKSTVVIMAAAQDNVGIASVAFAVNGDIRCTVLSAPYTCTWKVPAPANRDYTLSTLATDTSGNAQRSASVTVTAR